MAAVSLQFSDAALDRQFCRWSIPAHGNIADPTLVFDVARCLFGRLEAVKKGLRFVGVGIVSTATYFAISLSLVGLARIDVKIANVVAYLAGMVVSYAGHRHITFQSRGNIVREGWKFALMHGFNLSLSTLMLLVLVDHWRINRYAALVGTNMTVMLISFVIMQLWVFRDKSAGGEALTERSGSY
jgi:putative flippase GtrA